MQSGSKTSFDAQYQRLLQPLKACSPKPSMRIRALCAVSVRSSIIKSTI